MNKDLFKHLVKIRAICFLLIMLTGSPVLAQVKPTQLLGDTRSFEVSACSPKKNSIISVWMEKRPGRKDNSEEAADMCVAYKSSVNNGKDWTKKAIVDLPNTFATGNPFVATNEKGDAYMVCMHIHPEFFAGNISFYEFDVNKKQFRLKSVPFASESRLLDKPSFVSIGNEIHLVYAAYTRNFRTSVRYQMSKDKGQTWTEPVSVFSDSTIRYLGPAITVLKGNQVAISAGSYGRNNVYFVKKKITGDRIAFESPIVVSQVSAKLVSAMTQLSNDNNRLLLTWQNPHQRSETWMSFSTDNGDTWTESHRITENGNLLSSVFDRNGNIHCIYSDFRDQKFFVGYKLLNSKYKLLKEENLSKPVPLSAFNEYLGAYQKLLISGKQIFAFWINYPDNSSLNFTTWKL